MAEPEIQMAYPLAFPEGRRRTPDAERKPALFRNEGSRMTLTSARARLREQVRAMTRPRQTWRVTDMVLSTNIRFTASGTRDKNVSRREPEDPGVAFYFELDRRPHVLACDRWDVVADNIAAIAAHIEALRGQERWGVADLRQAFAGHTALPAPGQVGALPWRAVLGLSGVISRAAIEAAYRDRAKKAHPDRGGSRQDWERLVAAYEQAKIEVPIDG